MRTVTGPTNKVILYTSRYQGLRNLRIWVIVIIFCLTRPHHATGNFKEFLWAVTLVLVLLSLPTQSLWLIKEKYTHTFLGGNSPYMTHLVLRRKKKNKLSLPLFNTVIAMFTHGVD